MKVFKDNLNNYIKDGWFFEKDTFNTGYTQGLKVTEVLYNNRSKYQDILVFKSENRGNVLALDGAIQCVENDEFVYQEMMTFLPINSHKNPSNVLVIGGGDGGILRELDRHPLVKNVTLCEIDEEVINVSKKYLPKMAVGFNSKKCNIIIQDAFEFLKVSPNKYDIIICDLSDPDGPSEQLYTKESLLLMKNILNDDGIMCLQSESIWLSLSLISTLIEYCDNIFPITSYASFYTPTYPCGQIGALLCSKNNNTDFKNPLFIMNPDEYHLNYYSPQTHTASFVLPNFVQNVLFKKK